MSALRIGVYPGTFDPITKGHNDVIARAAKHFDRLVVAVAVNDGKGPLFSLEQRVAMVEADIAPVRARGHDVVVMPFDILLMHFVASIGATAIVRGLRAVSDFEYEFQMASMNARLNDQIETLFLMSADKYQFISSRFVKEIARLHGDVSQFVSADVNRHLRNRFPTA